MRMQHLGSLNSCRTTHSCTLNTRRHEIGHLRVKLPLCVRVCLCLCLCVLVCVYSICIQSACLHLAFLDLAWLPVLLLLLLLHLLQTTEMLPRFCFRRLSCINSFDGDESIAV